MYTIVLKDGDKRIFSIHKHTIASALFALNGFVCAKYQISPAANCHIKERDNHE